MADNDRSKIRYDDFIGNVQPDPAKPESTIMLSGFVGHGPEGHARVYPDPTLGTWYDIPEGDILHSMPIADSKLGGSHIWVRASAQIKPGSAAGGTGEVAEAAPAAGIALQPTPATHCFICPPHTLAVHCWTAPVVCDNMQMPTPATHCFICPPHTQNCTPATICTLHGHCPPQHSVPPTLCAVPQTLPCSLLCQADPRAAAAPAALPHTAATVCTQFGCPPQGPVGGQVGTFHFTNWCSLVGCNPPTNGCGVAGGAPQAAGVLPQTHFLCTQGLATFCGCTPGIDCNAPAPQPHQTHFLCTQGLATFCGCTPGIDCMAPAARAAPQQAATGVTVCVTDCQPPVNQMMRAPVGNPMDPTPQSLCFVCDPPKMAAAMQPTPTVQTHCFICPPHTVGVHCWTAPVVCGILPPSFGCQQGGAQPQHAMAMAAPAHPNTAATLCTQQPACPPHTVHNSLCICPTPSAVHQCGGQALPQFTLFTVAGMCPTVGVCPSMACTPMTPIQNGVFTPFGR